MLTAEEIQKIVEAEKEVFPTKQDLTLFQEEMRKNFSTAKFNLKLEY